MEINQEQELIRRIEKANRFKTLQDNAVFYEFLEDFLYEALNLWGACKPSESELLMKCKYEFDLINRQKTRCLTVLEQGEQAFKDLENSRKE